MTLSPDFVDRMGPRIAYWLEAQVTVIILIVALVPIPEKNTQLFNQIVTTILAGDMLLLSFLYGTSVGSRAKDNALAQAATQNQGVNQ